MNQDNPDSKNIGTNVVPLHKDGTGAALAVKQELTFEQAQNAARRYALDLYRKAVEDKQTAYAALEAAVGGPTGQLDNGVLQQGEAFMTRLALIGNRIGVGDHPQQGAASAVKKAVVDLSKVVAVLRAAALTHRADGLFRPVEERDYVAVAYDRTERSENVLAFVAPEARPTVQTWLDDNVRIVKPEPPKPAPPGDKKGPTKTLIVATLPATVADAKPAPLAAAAKKDDHAGRTSGVDDAPGGGKKAPVSPVTDTEKPAAPKPAAKKATPKAAPAKKANATKKGAKKR